MVICFCVSAVCLTVIICVWSYLRYVYDDEVYVTKSYVDNNFVRKDP